MHDLLILGATVVDGSGEPKYIADVAVKDGLIVDIGSLKGQATTRTIDAGGLLLTPGWVDMHTHYDGQVTWDPYLTPSGYHGVTTAIMGNCGVGFAPCKKEDRDWLINVMEGVEDIPGSALHEGIKWDWETFPEYMNALSRSPLAIDVGTQVPHAALRAYVMGRRASENNEPTDDEINTMSELTYEALKHGALGFTTSRTPLHKTAEGIFVAGTFAPERELLGIGDALKRAGKGVFEVAPDHGMVPTEFEWMRKLATHTGRPVVFNLSQTDFHTTLWKKGLQLLEEAQKDGVPVYAQCAGRSIGILMHLRGTAHPFAKHPSFMAIQNLPWETQLERLRNPEFKKTLLAESPKTTNFFEQMITMSFHKMFPMEVANYEPAPENSLEAQSKAQHKPAIELAFDWLIRNDGDGILYFPLFNYSDGSLDVVHTLHSHPQTKMGLADGGAHCGAICDGGMPTFMLSFWTRDRTRGPRLPLEYIVKRQTSDTAHFYGLHDRGLIQVGKKADLNLIDYNSLGFKTPKMVFDLPANGRRLMQEATGYVETFVSGISIMKDGQQTGMQPGRVVT